MLSTTTMRLLKSLKSLTLARRTTSSPTVVRFLSEMSASSALKSSSHRRTVVMISRVSTSTATTQSLSATTTFVKISSKTLSCLVVQPSLKAWVSVCGKNSISWHHPPIKSRFWRHPSVNTLCGLVVLSSHLSPLSRPCGSTSKSTTKTAPRSSTESASERGLILYIIQVYSLQRDNIYLILRLLHLPFPI